MGSCHWGHSSPSTEPIHNFLRTNQDHDTGFDYSFGQLLMFKPTLVVGLSQSTYLKTTTFAPPWAVLTTPTLRTTHANLTDTRMWYELKRPKDELYDMSDGGCSSVKHAILDLSSMASEFWADGDALRRLHGVYGVAKKILKYILEHLTLQLRLSCRTEPQG
jgi:hypothetical protein